MVNSTGAFACPQGSVIIKCTNRYMYSMRFIIFANLYIYHGSRVLYSISYIALTLRAASLGVVAVYAVQH